MASVEEHNWRAGLSLLQRIKHMLEGKYSCDVTLQVAHSDSEETIEAHKFILIAGSPYFESLIQKSSNNIITVNNFSPSVMKQVIRFLYTEEKDLDDNSVMDVLAASKEFEIPLLTKLCSEHIEKHLNADNVCTILSQCIQYKAKDLVNRCDDVIAGQAQQVIASDAFTKLSKEALRRVVENDKVVNVKETDIFDACVKWSREKCKKTGKNWNTESCRELLGDVLYQIRFPTMSNVELAQCMRNAANLTGNEQAVVHNYIALKGADIDDVDVEQFNPRIRNKERVDLPNERDVTEKIKNLIITMQNTSDRSERPRLVPAEEVVTPKKRSENKKRVVVNESNTELCKYCCAFMLPDAYFCNTCGKAKTL